MAEQSIAPELVADFRALTDVTMRRGQTAKRDAMLRIGYFSPATLLHLQRVFHHVFEVAMAPIRQEAPFDFGAGALLEQLRDMVLAIGNDRVLGHIPLTARLFLQRKIGGMYLIAARLCARRPCDPWSRPGACETQRCVEIFGHDAIWCNSPLKAAHR